MFKKNTSLGKEITCLFVAKGILLFLLWYFCFSQPIDTHDVKMMSHAVDAHFGFSSNSVKNR